MSPFETPIVDRSFNRTHDAPLICTPDCLVVY